MADRGETGFSGTVGSAAQGEVAALETVKVASVDRGI